MNVGISCILGIAVVLGHNREVSRKVHLGMKSYFEPKLEGARDSLEQVGQV